MNASTWTIIRKELLRVFTDRRLVFTTFILPALSLALIYSIMGTMISGVDQDREAHVSSVVLMEAPQTFVEMAKAEEDMSISLLGDTSVEALSEQIKAGEVDLLIQFPADFSQRIEAYTDQTPPEVKTLYNPSEEYSRDARRRMMEVLETYKQDILGERLGNTGYAKVFEIDATGDNQAVDQAKATGKGLSALLPMLISIFLFSGAMSIGVDSIAGEKERGTMATMLITPVSRQAIIYGKILSLAIVAIMTALSSFVGILISFPFSAMMFSGTSGSSNVDLGALQFGPEHLFILVALMLTLAMVYVGLIIGFSMFAKTVKEAGLYVTPIYMVIMVAGFSTMFTTGTPDLWRYAVPVYGSIIAMKGLLTMELSWMAFGLTVGGSVLSIAILVYFIQKLFDNERILFGV